MKLPELKKHILHLFKPYKFYERVEFQLDLIASKIVLSEIVESYEAFYITEREAFNMMYDVYVRVWNDYINDWQFPQKFSISPPLFSISAITQKELSKSSNGDNFIYFPVQGTDYFALCVADGVGSTGTDFIASKLACKSFKTYLNKYSHLKNNPVKWLEKALKEVNADLLQFGNSSKQYLSTFCGGICDFHTPYIYLVNIGDSRCYRINDGVIQLTEDQVKGVVVKGPDGKPLISSGSVVTTMAITNALGTPDNTISVIKADFKPGDTLCFCSDGFYNILPEFETRQFKFHEDLYTDGLLSQFFNGFESSQTDDATAVFFKNTNFGPGEKNRLLTQFIASGKAEGFSTTFILNDIFYATKNFEADLIFKIMLQYEKSPVYINQRTVEVLIEKAKENEREDLIPYFVKGIRKWHTKRTN